MNEEERNNLNFRLLACWIGGVVAAMLVTLVFSVGPAPRLGPITGEVLKWIAQMLGPICLLVLSRVLGQRVLQNFGANVEWVKVHRLTLMLSVVFIGVAVGIIVWSAFVSGAGQDTADAKFLQLQTLSGTGTVILVVILWPILSMLLDFLFAVSQPNASSPSSPVPTQTPPMPGLGAG